MVIGTRDLLLHPIRLRIVQAVAGLPRTPRELLELLGDVPQASLYRHIKHLADGGLIEVVDERPVRGTVERTYGLVSDAASLSGADLESANPEDHARYFTTFVGTLISDFARYLEAGDPALEADRVGYRQVPLWLTDDEFDQLSEVISTAFAERLDNQPAPGRRRRLFTTIVMPGEGG